ncbi:sulfotransferase [Pseudomonadota bacterium]
MSKQNVLIRRKKEKAEALIGQQRFDEAKTLYQQICRVSKQDLASWMDLGFIHGQLKEFEAAANCFKHVTQQNPTVAEAYFNMGKALRALGHNDEAEASYLKAIELQPRWIQAYNNLGNLLQSIGRYDNALQCYQKALAIEPNYIEAKINLSNLMQLLGHFDASMEGYYEALKLKPNHLPALRSLARALALTNRLDEALAYYDKALQSAPGSNEFLGQKAQIYDLRGDKQAAYDLLEPLINKGNVDTQVAVAFASVCHLGNRCDEAISLIEEHLQHEKMKYDLEQAPDLHFAIAKRYDKNNRFDDAFKHYEAANDLRVRPFNTERHSQYIDRIIDTFTAEALTKKSCSTTPSQRAVFIVGMPRSGTSLVEQILASHPDVAGGGELDTIKHISEKIPTQLSSNGSYPESFASLTAEASNSATQLYMDKLTEISADTRYVTDKMPQNFLYLGLISKLFPDAHIIHCQRDPLDVCLSCYFQDFAQHQNFSFKLETLAPYYLQYKRLMHHWQNVINIPMFNIRYEELIDDQEKLTRSLLNYLDLEWNDACLNFHKNKRQVNTASYDQVRQPLYSSSVGRWKYYRQQIKQVIETFNAASDIGG